MTARMRRRLHRRAGIASAALGLFCLVLLPSPAAATHDDYGPRNVILHDRPGPDRVEVVYPADADHEAVVAEVLQFADHHGIALEDVRAMDNLGPDTVRVTGELTLGQRQGPLEHVVLVTAMEPWRQLFPDGHVHLSLPRMAVVDGVRVGGDLSDPDADVTYRMPVLTVVGPLVVAVGGVLLVFVLLRYFARRAAAGADSPQAALHRIQRLTVVVVALAPLAVAGGAFLLGGLRWPEILIAVAAPGLQVPASLRSVLAVLGFLVPLVAVVVAAVVAVAPVDRELRRTHQTTRSAVGMNLRVLSLSLLPMVLFFAAFSFLPRANTWLTVVGVVLLTGSFVVLAPFLMKAVLPTSQVPGPLRERLLTQCHEEGLRVRDVVVLRTQGGRIANAAITGVVPHLRYIFLTDHALDVLEEEELSAVLSHEIGHGKEHHLLLKLVAVLTFVGAFVGAFALGGERLFRGLIDVVPPMVLVLLVPVVLLLGVVLIQGVVGIYLEKRADDYAARRVGAGTLASALDQLAEANFATRRTGTLWNLLQQHPGLEQRIERLGSQRRTDDTGSEDSRAEERADEPDHG